MSYARRRLFTSCHILRYRATWFLERQWRRLQRTFPWLKNEGEATAEVVDAAFDRGFPMVKDYADMDAAVQHLQDIWNIIDNYDGSRLNVEWARNGIPKGWLHRQSVGSQSEKTK